MLKKYVECGKIVSTHGIRGELKVLTWTDTPEYLYDFDVIYTDRGKKSYKILNARVHKKMILLTLEGIDTMDKANELRGEVVYIDRDQDPDDTPYVQDFMGVKVVDIDTEKSYGEIVDFIETGANHVYVLKDKDNIQRLIPDIPSVVLETNLKEKTMKIRPLEGLFDED